MRKAKILAIGDNVCDKYLSRGKMYPGGQCVNTCAYAGMNDVSAAFLGKFGSDEVASCVRETLKRLQVDISHCRSYEGENGFACVTLDGTDRVFIGSNRGGVASEHPYDFTEEDFIYMREFDLIYTNLNAYIEDELEAVSATGVPVAFDFSLRWTDEYLKQICPHIKIAMMSCAHLDEKTRKQEMEKAAGLGVPIVLGTIGEDGSYLLYQGNYYYCEAVKAENVIDTMGAGDSYFAAFLSYLLKLHVNGAIKTDRAMDLSQVLMEAMKEGAVFAARICCEEGAFGFGVPIAGRVIDNRIQS